MTVSVIIPVYNVEKYIRRCIDSVISQKCDCFDIECIIVDDCSPDGSMAIVQEMVDGYDGSLISFHIIRHEVNRGLCVARNSGIKASNGDYLFFIDSDDDILENTLITLVRYSLDHPMTDIIMGDSIEMEKAQQKNEIVDGEFYPILINDRQELWENVLRRRIDRHVWNKLIRRSLIIDNNLMFDEGLLYEDVIWTYKLYALASSVLIIPELTYLYEYNPESIIHTISKRPNQIVSSFAYMSDYIFDHPPVIDGNNCFYVAHRLFVYHWMMMAIDIKNRYRVDKDVSKSISNLKFRMLVDAIRHLRPFLVIYFLTMFAPLMFLTKFRWFRVNLDKIDRLVYKLS